MLHVCEFSPVCQLRTVKATAMNSVSSRSHFICQITICQDQIQTVAGQLVHVQRCSKISLVDLAGSERAGVINTGREDRMREVCLL